MGISVSCNCNKDNLSGCIVCGHVLFYTPDMPFRAKCFFCGKEETTNVFCLEGHYVCDDCHSKDILEIVEKACINSSLTDPVELALQIFALPTLHMHGPEYHSIVPAVLVTAYGNSNNKKNIEAIREAISRGKAVIGGVCGTHGSCGAGIGIGIAYSIINRVTPYSTDERGRANQMTAHALTAISKVGGPRCCKRDSMIAIESAIEKFKCFASTGKSKYICSQYIDNDMCIKGQCPYFTGKE